jgi:phosphoglycolate phosphatase
MENGPIIFDWSGTISDDRIPVYESNKILLQKYNKPVPSFDNFMTQTLGSFPEFIKSLGVDLDDETLYTQYTTCYREVVNQGISPDIYPDAKKVLERLSNGVRKLAILSSHPQHSLEGEAEQYGIRKHFKIIRGDVINKSRNLHTLCLDLNVLPNEVIYLGDMVQDVLSSKEAGLTSAAVSTGYHSRDRLEESQPCLGVFDSLEHFLESII